MFEYNEIVRGKVAGVFVYLGMSKLPDNLTYARLKPLDGNMKPMPGEICLPLDRIEKFNKQEA